MLYTSFDRALDAHEGKLPKEELKGAAKHIFESYTKSQMLAFKARTVPRKSYHPTTNQRCYKSR